MSLHETQAKEWKALRDDLSLLEADGRSGSDSLSLVFSVKSGLPRGGHLEFESTLTLVESGKGTLLRRRDGGETCQEAPGLYAGMVPLEELQQFLSSIREGDFSFKRLEGQQPGDTLFSLELSLVGRVYCWSWGIPDIDSCEGLQTVLAFLYDWGSVYFNQPIWALSLDAGPLKTANAFVEGELRLSNPGERSINIVHPDRAGNGAISYLFFQYGEKQQMTPGVTPLPMELSRTKLDFTPHDRMEVVSIPPRGVFTLRFSQSLGSPLPENWLGSFCLYSYAGQDEIAGNEIFSGAVYSPEVEG